LCIKFTPGEDVGDCSEDIPDFCPLPCLGALLKERVEKGLEVIKVGSDYFCANIQGRHSATKNDNSIIVSKGDRIIIERKEVKFMNGHCEICKSPIDKERGLCRACDNELINQ
jgi:hypothetical protein